MARMPAISLCCCSGILIFVKTSVDLMQGDRDELLKLWLTSVQPRSFCKLKRRISWIGRIDLRIKNQFCQLVNIFSGNISGMSDVNKNGKANDLVLCCWRSWVFG